MFQAMETSQELYRLSVSRDRQFLRTPCFSDIRSYPQASSIKHSVMSETDLKEGGSVH